ncbi:MAG: ECF transporter S component [Ruminococcus sp.]|nr:ECF transporter S component [Ruminococcus sp.]MCM1382188.1 ECF transporter S component [Muribaculaceae bacterium]
MSKTREKTLMLATLGLLSAVTVVLQIVASAVRLGPFTITLAIMPIVVGGAMYGWKGGAWLGFVFGIVVLLTDGTIPILMPINAPATVAVCLLKGMLAGAAAAAVYRLLERKNNWLAIIAAGIVCPIVNTGALVGGLLLFFRGTLVEWSAGQNLFSYIIFGMVGANFLVETGVNLLLGTVVDRIIKVVKKPAAQA